jgi:N-acetylneuraminic acid mutarotase
MWARRHTTIVSAPASARCSMYACCDPAFRLSNGADVTVGSVVRRQPIVVLAILVVCCRHGTKPSPVSGDGTWVSLAPLPEARQEVGVAELQGRIYVVGGYRPDHSSANTVEVYDPGSDRWTMAAPLPEGVNHPAAAVVGERLYVVGGDNGRGSVATNFEYDPRSDSWTARTPMPTARSAPMAAVIGGRIYVAGGAPGSVGRTLEAYDPGTDRWTSLPPMPTARNHVAGGAIGGRLYVVGGRPPNTLDALEIFDPAAASWATGAPMPTGRSGHAAAVVRGCLYVFGGEGNANTPSGVFSEAEVYDPGSGTWTALAPMPSPRHGIGAAVIGDRIFVPGGASVQGFGAVGTHDAFLVPSGQRCS